MIVVLANQDAAAARRRIERVIALAQPAPRHNVKVSFVSLSDLHERGPFAQIFISAEQPERYIDWLGQPQPQR